MSTYILNGDLILFQGDSLTDGGRCGTADGLGNGYVAMVRALMVARHGDLKVTIANRGVSGDRSVELLARWQADCVALRPQVLSIMVGVNDVWRLRGAWNGQTFVDAAEYRANCSAMISQALAVGVRTLAIASPTTICEENDSELSRLLEERAAIVRELAAQFGCRYVPTREAYLKALSDHREVRWTTDGCHPTQAGHALLAGIWLEAMGL